MKAWLVVDLLAPLSPGEFNQVEETLTALDCEPARLTHTPFKRKDRRVDSLYMLARMRRTLAPDTLIVCVTRSKLAYPLATHPDGIWGLADMGAPRILLTSNDHDVVRLRSTTHHEWWHTRGFGHCVAGRHLACVMSIQPRDISVLTPCGQCIAYYRGALAVR